MVTYKSITFSSIKISFFLFGHVKRMNTEYQKYYSKSRCMEEYPEADHTAERPS
jgi:hypothetical protein